MSSPGDVFLERDIARNVIQKLNTDPFLRDKVALRPIAWDDPASRTPQLATLTPQEAINQGMPKPSECDIVVVILWARMGTPLPSEYVKDDGSRFLSGTEWEFEDARRAAEASGLPLLVVYRRMEPAMVDLDAPDFQERSEQKQKVNEFFRRFSAPDGSIVGGINPYNTTDDFREKLENDLKVLINSLPENRVITSQHSLPHGAMVEHAPAWPASKSPFPGLRAFTTDDEPVFFGRDHEVDEVLKRILDGSFLAIVGASGSGKSSLVNAGLIPRLSKIPDSKDWLWLRFAPGEVSDDPILALSVQLASKLGKPAREVASMLTRQPDTLVSLVESVLSDKPKWAQLLLFIDQFEELFTVVPPDHRTAFINVLSVATGAERLRTVVTLRADFLDRFVAEPQLAEILNFGTYVLSAPDQRALYEMITHPPAVAGLDLDSELAWRILQDTGTEPGALALMAYTLDELFRISGTTEPRTLSIHDYERLGGVQGALGVRAENVYSNLDPEVQSALPRVFATLVNIDEHGTIARRYANLSSFVHDSAGQKLVEALIGARLLVSNQGTTGTPVVEVAHEALFTNWKRLSEWIDSVKGDLQLLNQVTLAAQEWVQNGRPDFYLWSHERLLSVYECLPRLAELKLELPPEVMGFIRPETERLLEEFGDVDTPTYRRLGIVDRIEGFGVLGVEALIDALWILLGEENTDDVCTSVLSKLGKYPDVVIPIFEEYLTNEKPSVRIVGAWALGKIGNHDTVPLLIRGLDDTDPEVRTWLVRALGELGGPEAVNALVNIIDDGEQGKAYNAAVGALSVIGGAVAVRALLDALRKDSRNQISVVDIHIATRNTSKDDTEVLSIFVDALKDANSRIRQVAARELGKIGDVRACTVLVDAAQDSDADVRQTAIQSLGKLRDTSSLVCLVQSLDDPAIRYEAGKSLDEFQKDQIPSIVDLLDNSDEIQRNAALITLKRIGKKNLPALIEAANNASELKYKALIEICADIADDSLVPVLIEALKHEVSEVRITAARGLANTDNPSVVSAFAEAINDTDVAVRRQIVKSLSKMGSDPNTTSILLQALTDPDKDIRVQAIRALSECRDDAVIQGLVDRLADPEYDVRREVSAALRSIGKHASRYVSTCLKNENPLVRKLAAEILGDLQDPGAAPTLISSFEDSDSDVRNAALDAVVKIGNSSIPFLIEVLGHSDRFVRQLAVNALGRLGAESAGPQIIELLGDPDVEVQAAAALALGKLKHKSAIPHLLKMVCMPRWTTSNSAAEALTYFGDDVIHDLIGLLVDAHGSIRSGIAEAIGSIGNPIAVPALIEALENSVDFNDRWTLVEALGSLKDEAASPALVKTLSDPEIYVRRAAAIALGEIRDPNTVADLALALNDPDDDVRRAAAKSLEQFGTPEASEAVKQWRNRN